MILRKIETVTDIRRYEVELTPEQEKLWNSNQDEFWEMYEDDIHGYMDLVHEDIGDPDVEWEVALPDDEIY
jgi:hypothetical protein|tara:strand:- start:370 stop:582 length:213 start_codon:yes stop_codon:yes gene_type:complete